MDNKIVIIIIVIALAIGAYFLFFNKGFGSYITYKAGRKEKSKEYLHWMVIANDLKHKMIQEGKDQHDVNIVCEIIGKLNYSVQNLTESVKNRLTGYANKYHWSYILDRADVEY